MGFQNFLFPDLGFPFFFFCFVFSFGCFVGFLGCFLPVGPAILDRQDRVDVSTLRDAGFGQRGRLLRGAKANGLKWSQRVSTSVSLVEFSIFFGACFCYRSWVDFCLVDLGLNVHFCLFGVWLG